MRHGGRRDKLLGFGGRANGLQAALEIGGLAFVESLLAAIPVLTGDDGELLLWRSPLEEEKIEKK